MPGTVFPVAVTASAGPGLGFFPHMQDFSACCTLTAGRFSRRIRQPMRSPKTSLARLLAILPFLLLPAVGSVPNVSLPRANPPAGGEIFYFLLTDRFANGRKDNDTGGIAGGRDQHGFDPTAISHYHGGDFAGLTARLDYLQGLGITALWVTPPFRNKPVQSGTAGYHGYWILDFLHVDPHLGTDAEFGEFVAQAHARGIKVFMDVILNHTADVIVPRGGDVTYRDRAAWPYRDAQGRPFDEASLAWNGLGQPKPFPELSAATSFPHPPVVPAGEENSKNPAWLNDVRYYHNRGNTDFTGEKSLHGDFVGLDDLFTEHPDVVRGLIDIYRQWIERFKVDGFRIDTVKHTNLELWQAFGPAMHAAARAAGRPSFFLFGEIATDDTDATLLSEFTTLGTLDAAIDFPFAIAARDFIGRRGPASALAAMFEQDDRYTDHDSNALLLPTFLGNHDQGRFAYFLKQLDPSADADRLLALSKLGHTLLFLARGQPVLYYGDEQGMIGRGGNDMQARESMFASQAPDFRSASLLGTTRTGADDKYDSQHPLYRHIAGLTALRAAHPALSRGAMILRPTGHEQVFAFSRIERGQRIEYVAALSNRRDGAIEVSIPTSQPAGAEVRLVYAFGENSAAVGTTARLGEAGRLHCHIPALGAVLWRAERPLASPAEKPRIALAAPTGAARLAFGARDIDGQVLAERQEIRAAVTGGDGVAEVTFLMARSSRPGAWEYLGTDDAPPYRIFWRPPGDLKKDETVSFAVTVDDLRGGRASALVENVAVNMPAARSGIAGAVLPAFSQLPPESVAFTADQEITLSADATGTPAPAFQWYRNGTAIAGATDRTLRLTPRPGDDGTRLTVVARNLAGAAVNRESVLRDAAIGSVERLPELKSRHVAPRPVDVWLPPGYAAAPDARFPVIYMHDGQNLFFGDTSYGGVPWAVDRTLARLVKEKRCSPAIVVGIWNSGQTRAAEYMPQKAVNGAGQVQGGVFRLRPEELRADAYLRYLVEELKPQIDRTYRTQPGREHTFVMGSSMGGLISAYALVEFPNVFGGAACVSTHWPAGDGCAIDYLAKHLPPPGRHKLYFDFGTATLDAHYEPYQLRMDEVMRHAGYVPGRDWVTRKFPGEDHSEIAWSRRVDVPLEFLLGPGR